MSEATITPTPTDEEAAAIVAAIDSVVSSGQQASPRSEAPRWRFSGRWWTKPAPMRRRRPWVP